MASKDSAAELVARFLRSNNYHDTLAAFLQESGLPPDTGTVTPNALTIEQVLQEKISFDLARNFEKLGTEDEGDVEKAWSLPAPSNGTIVGSLPGAANLLHVAVEVVTSSTESGKDDETNHVVATAADRTTTLLSTTPPFDQACGEVPVSESPILSCVVVAKRYLVMSSMAGTLRVFDLKTKKSLDERRDHSKYIVKIVASNPDNDGVWIASAAWDAKVLLYRLDLSSGSDVKLGSPKGVITLQTNPEALCFIEHPEISTPVLLVSRRDSTFLYYYAIPDAITIDSKGPLSMTLLGRQNLAPHSNAWIAFTPSSLALSPRDPSVLAVATSTVPHMKIIILRLLLPPPKTVGSSLNGAAAAANTTPAARARADLAAQDREAAAIIVHCSTLAPQTPFSTPGLAWRPDGSGVWVNGDDGVIRGVEAASGKIVASLREGHEQGAKIRCLWSGWVDVEGKREEWLVSGGFDRRLIVWRVEES